MHNCIYWQAVLQTDGGGCARQNRRMADYKTESVGFLRQLIEETGKTATELARLVSVASTTLTRPLNSAEHKYAVKFQTLQALAEKTGIAMPRSLITARVSGRGPPPAQLHLPVRFEVAAGGFLLRDDLPQEPYGFRTVSSIPPYEFNTQWLERVVSDSMNRVIPEESTIHVVDAIEIRYRPVHGAIVVVERTRDQGALVERTVKQVELTPSGVELWPRSHNPRWSKPIYLGAGLRDGEEATAEIVGVVLRSYMFFTPEDVAEFEGEAASSRA